MKQGGMIWISLVAILVILELTGVVALNARAKNRGYKIPGRALVRCSQGHEYRSLWVIGGSFKAVRLGPFLRYQWCAECHHFRLTRPVVENGK